MENRQSTRLSGAHLRLFVAILVQNEGVFEHFKGRLTVEHFEEDEYRLLYRAVLDHYATHSSLPSFAEIETGLESFFEEDSEIISESSREELEDFLAYAFNPELFSDYPVNSAKFEKFAYNAGKKFLLQYQKAILEQTFRTETSLDQLPFILRAAQSQIELIQLSSYHAGATLSFPEHWDIKAARTIQSTGIGFLDKYLGGGAAKGEVYGVMAPYGTCKTTLAVMLWCTTAQQAYEQTLMDEWDGRKGLSVLVTYETPLAPEIQRRSVMYAAQVSRYSLDRMAGVGLSMLRDDPENPEAYEKRIFKQAIADGVFRPERKRVEDTIVWLNEHTLCLDFSGSDKRFPTAGNGGINEIIERIKMELRSRNDNYYVKNVIIDYLGLMIDRDLSLKVDKRSIAEDHKTYQQAGERIAKEICKQHFDCHAWVFHQLSGTANAMLSPTKTLHHTDAKGSKSFAENLDHCFVFGNLNNDSMGQIACTKHRHWHRLPPSIIKVDGEFNLVFSPENFHIDSDGKIVDKSTASTAGISASQFEALQAEANTAYVSNESDENDSDEND